MGWSKDAITEGELDALQRVSQAACNHDTRYPLWHGSTQAGQGECRNIACWLVDRLGGKVGRSQGHYVWLSPDDSYYIDLTNGHHSGWVYARNDGTYHPTSGEVNDRSQSFIKRANRIFEQLPNFIRLGLDYAGDAFPAEEPQAADDSDRFNDSWNDPEQYWHDEPDPTAPEGVYQFIYANGSLEVSPNHGHDELAQHAGIVPAQYSGPFAAGHVVVNNGKATWEVQSNVNLHAFFKVLKDASKQYGWLWGGMTDAQGQPILETFEPKKSARILHYVLAGGHLFLGRTSAADLALRACGELGDRDGDSDLHVVAGAIRVVEGQGWINPVYEEALPHLFDWARDTGLTLYANNDNVIKTIPDEQQFNNYNPDDPLPSDPVEPKPVDERLPSGLYRCPACQQLFPNWHEYQKHRRDQESWGDTDAETVGDRGGLPEPDHDIFGDGAHYTEMRQTPGITTGAVVLPARTWKEAARVDGFAKYASAFDYARDEGLAFYVAYRNGSPLGYTVVDGDFITMMHSAVENQGVGQAMWDKLSRHYKTLRTNAAHEKTAGLLKRRGWVQASPVLWKWSVEKSPKDLLEAPIPFIYDVDKDKIFMGNPGARTSDIPGRFTPGGIVEGQYEPGGKVVIRTMTSVPYTVRHMIELWYYSNPQMEVKSVHLQDDAGKSTKLASSNIGPYVQTMAAADPAVALASQILQSAGGEVFAVGGAVRDAVMGKEPKDIDLMVTGIPAQKVSDLLEALPGRVDFTGRDFGVFRYRYKGYEAEIALPRRERSTGVGHQEFDVQADHTMKPEDDFYRRDFTANAMGVNLRDGSLVDPFNGTADIKAGTLRTLNDRSLAEDPLRVVRALVANGRHGLDPDEATRAQMRNHAHGLTNLPAERIQAELDKLMASDNPAKAIRLAHETGVLKYILPEVEDAMGYSQNNPHHELELGDHLLNVLDRISKKTKDPDLRLAALLHDIGKPGSAWEDPQTGMNHFYEHHMADGTILGADHEKLGADMARLRMNELRYPKIRTDRVTDLIGHHMWPSFTTDRGARRFLHRVGDHADDLMTLRWADQGGKSAYPSDPTLSLDTQRSLIDRARNQGQATNKAQLAINGNDLLQAGIQQGPMMGQILNYLTERVVDDPELNDPAQLLRLAQDYASVQP